MSSMVLNEFGAVVEDGEGSIADAIHHGVELVGGGIVVVLLGGCR